MAERLKVKSGTKVQLACDVQAGGEPEFNLISTFYKALDDSAFLISVPMQGGKPMELDESLRLLPRIGTSPDGREQRDVVGVVCWEREAPKGSPFRMLCGLQLRFATTGERESYIRYVDNVRRKCAM